MGLAWLTVTEGDDGPRPLELRFVFPPACAPPRCVSLGRQNNNPPKRYISGGGALFGRENENPRIVTGGPNVHLSNDGTLVDVAFTLQRLLGVKKCRNNCGENDKGSQ